MDDIILVKTGQIVRPRTVQTASILGMLGMFQNANVNPAKRLELEVWHDLASVYISLSRWRDAEICLSKSKAISSYSASRCHTSGLLYEAKGLHKEAVKSFVGALDIDPTHVPSLISTAVALRRFGNQSNEVVRSLLMDALRLDRMNSSAWYNLGLLYKDEGAPSCIEAAECHGQLLNLVFAIGRMLDW
ncbi:hypothetical protein K2173_011071 [Erythroxylum novogranatense]|uniref:Uncharacterized protein n=1 Tax=Erythroxylum novogranatense TaxID=1862640 RepID=A0AAV8TLT0_9ROSI|nr:hypothetical protein K2173_011071 [Erythroxylum novogranatense]